MSTTTQRVLAMIAGAIIAALTGLGIWVLGTTVTCEVTASQPPAPPPSATVAAPGQINGAVPAATKPAATTTALARPAAAECTATGWSAAAPAALGLVGAATAAIAAAGVLIVAGRGATPPPARQASAAPAGAGGGSQDAADRSALVQICIYVRDRTTSKALGNRIAGALAACGVTAVEPTGARFDPACHEAGGTTPTSDPALAGTIAGIEAPGYTDRDGRPLRPPVVTVYQLGGRPQGLQGGTR
ncbi:MAG: nucleotide exchange factor GrpE [Micromonosporaceae bacterium]|nr:nucleotide exchange factor GrpE [Micromonosporaceae bacterium]